MKSSVTGFPEFSLAERQIEKQIIAGLENLFSLYGFPSLETSSVETIETLLKKGETSKEIYVLSRLQDHDTPKSPKIGLHFDLTVPFSRYISENLAALTYPFKRYQIQKVWRGERPQAGRFREFTQFDFDVVDRNTLANHLEADILRVFSAALSYLTTFGLPRVLISFNHRALIHEILNLLGIRKNVFHPIITLIDHMPKTKPEIIVEEFAKLKLTSAQIDSIMVIARINAKGKDELLNELVRFIKINDKILEIAQNLTEKMAILNEQNNIISQIDLSVVRGLDYYSGCVVETYFDQYSSYGSICSGGRYDSLITAAGDNFPGFGLSFGLTRILSFLFDHKIIIPDKLSPAKVLIAVSSEETRFLSENIAEIFRSRSIPAEVAPAAKKFGDQIKYADRLGIPFVWFIEGIKTYSVKNLISGTQIPADPLIWTPDNV
jgi:histidyl-tRNA synthetase